MSVDLFPAAPGVDPKTFSWQGSGRWHGPMTSEVARAIPGVARGISLTSGQLMQMPLDDYRGVRPLPRPALLDAPDPDESRAWFVQVQAEDYLLNGNALHLVTSRDASGWPATCTWIPAAWVWVTQDPKTREVAYWVGGRQLPTEDVVHVKRGADRMFPFRGLGIVEQHLDALGVIRDQHRYEAEVLDGAAVPSVAIITPNQRLSNEEAEDAQERWVEKYGQAGRKPSILPAGTQVVPLAWSPSDSQLVEARQLSLTDAANMLNLDGFWLGAPSSSHTYKSPGPMYLALLKQTLEPILAVFEDVWSAAWLPRGRRVRFDRRAVLSDDMQTMVTTANAAYAGGLWSREEARAYLGLDPDLTGTTVTSTSPVATVADGTGGTTPPAVPAAAGDDQENDDDPEEVAS